jgi:hypothetical protein
MTTLTLRALIVLTCSAALSGCSTTAEEPPPVAEQSQEEAAPARPPKAAAECRRVSRAKLAQIEAGLTVSGGGKLRRGFAVKSGDYNRLYFIAAEIDGPGIEGAGDIGLWASNRLEEGGLTSSVNAVANEFSDWGDGRKTDAQMSQDDAGAGEAVNCARER